MICTHIVETPYAVLAPVKLESYKTYKEEDPSFLENCALKMSTCKIDNFNSTFNLLLFNFAVAHLHKTFKLFCFAVF